MGNLSSGKSALVHRYLTGTYVQEESPEGKRPFYCGHLCPVFHLWDKRRSTLYSGCIKSRSEAYTGIMGGSLGSVSLQDQVARVQT